MASSNSQIYKPQCGHPERAELPDVNINTGAQSNERSALTIASYFQMHNLSLISCPSGLQGFNLAGLL